MSALTQIIPSHAEARTPLMIEVPIAPELDGPFLVSSSRDLLWIKNKFPQGVVRAAVRKVPLSFLFRDALLKVARESVARGWDSLHPPTAEGLLEAMAYLAEYDLTPVEILHGSRFERELLPPDVRATETTWVPADWAVVVPEDRAFVGTAVDFGSGQIALVLHNASRGIAFAAPGLTKLSDLDLTPRVAQLLQKDYNFAEDLGGSTASELRNIKGMGPRAVEQVRAALLVQGFSLKGE
jgi:hypothetical protein